MDVRRPGVIVWLVICTIPVLLGWQGWVVAAQSQPTDNTTPLRAQLPNCSILAIQVPGGTSYTGPDPILQRSEQSVSTAGDVTAQAGSAVSYQAPLISLDNGFSVLAGAVFSANALPVSCEFPSAAVFVQEPVRDDEDADAAATYPEGGPVIINSGEARLERTDLTAPGRGQLDFQLSRTYRSRLDYDGPLGYGWDFSYNERLSVLPDGDVDRANGRGRVDTWIKNPGGGYTAPTGYFGTLTLETDGRYLLRETDGFRRYYGPAGRLREYRDRFGNQMLFEYDAASNLNRVVDVYGRAYDLSYGLFAGRERLTVLRDYMGREVQYFYDGNGDLVAVRSPLVTGTSTGNDFPAGRTEAYSYLSGDPEPSLNHNLSEVTFPEEVESAGPAALAFRYGDAGVSLDRVTEMDLGGTNNTGIPAGGTATFVYEAMNEILLPDPDLPRLKVTVTERNGNQIVYLVNEFEHLKALRHLTRGVRPGEPPFYENYFYYDADGQMTSRMLPEGNSVQYTYDSAGSRAAKRNLLELRRVPDVSRGGGEDLVTTYSYEPVFNQLATITDPRGNASGFVPPIPPFSANRYRTYFYYDYQEDSGPVADAVKYGINLTGVMRNLGDLNEDAQTDGVVGNLLLAVEPTVMLLPGSNEALNGGDTIQPLLSQFQWNDRGQKLAGIDQEGNVTRFAYYPESDPDGDGTAVPGQSSVMPRGYLMSSTEDSSPPSARRTSPYATAELQSLFTYDAAGNLVSELNPRGVLTTWEVNQLNETVVQTRGVDIALAAASGQLITGEPAFAYQERYYHDFNGRRFLTETENRADVSTTSSVGDWVERATLFDILNNPVVQATEIGNGVQATMQRRYDGNELLIRLIKPQGNEVQVDYDERNLPFLVHNGFGSPDTATWQYDYDLNGNLSRRVDAEDNDGSGFPEDTVYSYDGFDRRTVETDALGGQRTFSYDVAGNLVREQFMGHRAGQPLAGNTLLRDTLFAHDELNRVYQTDETLFLADGFSPLRGEVLLDNNMDGFVTTFTEYDALSRQTFVVEDDLDTTSFIYDGANRLRQSSDALGNTLTRTYDNSDNLLEETSTEVSPEAIVADEIFTTRYVYDQLNRRVRVTDNGGRTTRYGYDSRDNQTTATDGEGPIIGPDPLGVFPGSVNGPGNSTTLHYDGRDLVVKEVRDLRVGGRGDGVLDSSNPANPDGQITVEYEYDLNARQVAVTDDNSNRTEYQYDALDRQVRKTNADATIHQYTYDRDGNRVLESDPTGNQVSNTFDVLNRLVQRDVVRGPGVVGTTQELYQYDGLSRLTASSDNNGSGAPHDLERIYDSLSRLLEEQQDAAPHSSVWFGDGNRRELVYPTTLITAYEYDAINRITRVYDPDARTSEAGRLSLGSISEMNWIGPADCSLQCPCDSRLLLMGFANGTEMSFLDAGGALDVGYNEVQEIVALRHQDEVMPFIDRAYEYNRAYRRTGELFGEVLDDPQNQYTLDSAYRIVTSDLGRNPPGEDFTTSIDYQLDGAGNRELVDVLQDFGGGSTFGFSNDYLVNVMNEYDDTDAGGGGAPRSHDPNGNLVDDGGFLYDYDYRNRLVRVNRKNDGKLRAAYEYDTYNRRVRKLLYDLAGPPFTLEQEVRYLYDEWQVIEEWGDDTDYFTNGPLATYVYGMDIDQPVQMITSVSAPAGAGIFYYHRDARNNVVAMTDTAGVVVENTRYDDYGNFTQAMSIGNPYLFQGRRHDAETDFYYFRNRYYDPLTGRFLQRDPVSDPTNLGNQYTFAGNNPLTGLDPSGLVWWNPFSWPDDYEDWKNARKAEKARKLAKEAKSLADALKSASKKTGKLKRLGDLAKGIAKKPLRGTGSDPIGLMIQIDESLEVVADNSKSIGEKIKLAREIEQAKHKMDPSYRLPMAERPFDWCVLDWLYYDAEDERRRKVNEAWDAEAVAAEEGGEE